MVWTYTKNNQYPWAILISCGIFKNCWRSLDRSPACKWTWKRSWIEIVVHTQLYCYWTEIHQIQSHHLSLIKQHNDWVKWKIWFFLLGVEGGWNAIMRRQIPFWIRCNKWLRQWQYDIIYKLDIRRYILVSNYMLHNN